MSAVVEKFGFVGRLFKSYPKSFLTTVLALVVALYILKVLLGIWNFFKEMELALSPPTLSKVEVEDTEYVNRVGGNGETSDWFHFAAQGTATVPIPYDWFVALEAPQSCLLYTSPSPRDS